MRVGGSVLLLVPWLAVADLLPESQPIEVRAGWALEGDLRVSPLDAPPGGGTRVAAWIEGDAPDPWVEARGVSGGTASPWVPLEVTHRGDGVFVAVIDLPAGDGPWPTAQVRLTDAESRRLTDLRWELLVPRFPDAGRLSREAGPEHRPMALDPMLSQIGVISREAWGARATTCSTTEDDWYRMAIHHTAGNQTSHGSVQGAVQSLQAYSMDSGEYCDIPYQFNVGYDGSLWEARPLTYYSGATGNNNDGNIAISFLGCYHPTSCPTPGGHAATDEMMSSSRLLAQTLVELHGIASDRDTIRGHQEWPDNATACPGDFVMARIDELTWDLAWYTGTYLSSTQPLANEGTLTLLPGEEVTITVELRNDGGLSWIPGQTMLAPTPRDTTSALAGASWAGTTRAATVDTTVPPGGTGRFTFTLASPTAVDAVQGFALVQEWVTWFGDAPWGGGPPDDTIAYHVVVVEEGPTETGGPPDTGPGETGADSGDGRPDGPRPGDDGDDPIVPITQLTPGTRSAVGGCGCDAGGAGFGAPAASALVILLGRRRR